MHDEVMGFEVTLMFEFSETNVTFELGFHSAFVLDVSYKVAFLLVRRTAIGAQISAISVHFEFHISEN